MSDLAEPLVLTVLVLSTSVWVGGYVAIAIVARATTAVLQPADRIALFRRLGGTYLRVGTVALVVALVTGAALVADHDWDALLASTASTAALLVLSLGVAVAQARQMTGLRRALLDQPDDQELARRVRGGGRAAGTLRGVLGLLSLALVVLGAFLATS